jgi:hypothetical protein
MTFENVPFEEIPHILTAEEAAKLAGYSPSTFLRAMGRLNRTSNDLRTPRTSGEGARRYDGDKVAEWIKAGKPLPEARSALGKSEQLPDEGDEGIDIKTVIGSATPSERGWNPNERGWIAKIREPEITAYGDNLASLRRAVAQVSGEKLGVEPRFIKVELSLNAPPEAQPHLANMRKIDDELEALAKQREDERLAAVMKMRDANLVLEDVGAILGLSQQRIHQLVNEIKKLSATEKARLQATKVKTMPEA